MYTCKSYIRVPTFTPISTLTSKSQNNSKHIDVSCSEFSRKIIVKKQKDFLDVTYGNYLKYTLKLLEVYIAEGPCR